MNEQTIETSTLDSKYFSQRAKHISLLNKPPTPPLSIPVKPSTEMYFQFSNRTYLSARDTPIGRGHGTPLSNESRQNISVGRGRTSIPSSPFLLQKDNLPSPSTSITSPAFVMHDEVQFVRPYFGPRNTTDTQSTSRKREILLSALKEIESGLKTL